MSAFIMAPYASVLLLFAFLYFFVYPFVDYIRDKHGMQPPVSHIDPGHNANLSQAFEDTLACRYSLACQVSLS